MLQVLKALFSSKKFLVMLAGIVLASASKLGLDLDPELVNQILALVGVYIVGQGIADRGKEATKTSAALGKAGPALALLLAIGAFGGLALSSGCKPYLPPVAHPVVDCFDESGGIPALVDSWWPKAGEKPDWSRIQSEAIAKGLNIGGCAFAKYVDRYLAPAPGTAVPPPEIAIDAKNAFEEYRSVHANNASFRFKDGSR